MNKKGFTLIELLVVIAIIGLLSTLAVVALNDARVKSRDAKRVSDIKQIQSALELHFADTNSYAVSTAITLGSAATKALCANGTASVGFASACTGTQTTYMGNVPANPTPGGAAYSYSGSTTDYAITFTLEKATGTLSSGARTATPAGIQ